MLIGTTLALESAPQTPAMFEPKKEEASFNQFFNTLKWLLINILIVDALRGMPKYLNYMQTIMACKNRALTEECSRVVRSTLPKKFDVLEYHPSYTNCQKGCWTCNVWARNKHKLNATACVQSSWPLKTTSNQYQLVTGKPVPLNTRWYQWGCAHKSWDIHHSHKLYNSRFWSRCLDADHSRMSLLSYKRSTNWCKGREDEYESLQQRNNFINWKSTLKNFTLWGSMLDYNSRHNI